MGFTDKLKDLVNKEISSEQGSSNNNAEQQQQSGGGAPQQAGQADGQQQEDYGDKALDFIESKTGHTFNRETNEKITDGVRDFYEKQTGSKVDSKWSN